MKILGVYDRGAGTDPTVILESTGTEARALAGAAAVLSADLQFDLPAVLGDATKLQAVVTKLRAALDQVSPPKVGP